MIQIYNGRCDWWLLQIFDLFIPWSSDSGSGSLALNQITSVTYCLSFSPAHVICPSPHLQAPFGQWPMAFKGKNMVGVSAIVRRVERRWRFCCRPWFILLMSRWVSSVSIFLELIEWMVDCLAKDLFDKVGGAPFTPTPHKPVNSHINTYDDGEVVVTVKMLALSCWLPFTW